MDSVPGNRVASRFQDAAHVPHLVFPVLGIVPNSVAENHGGGVAARLQNDRALGSVPIVFLTAMLSQSASAGIEREMAGRPVVSKPVHYQDLVACIERHTAPR